MRRIKLVLLEKKEIEIIKSAAGVSSNSISRGISVIAKRFVRYPIKIVGEAKDLPQKIFSGPVKAEPQVIPSYKEIEEYIGLKGLGITADEVIAHYGKSGWRKKNGGFIGSKWRSGVGGLNRGKIIRARRSQHEGA